MTRIYLVRHGTTDWNKEEIFRGRAECRLNETGKEEARALASYFRGYPDREHIQQPAVPGHGHRPPDSRIQRLAVVPDPAFTDLDFGAWQGLPLKEVQEKFPDLYRLWREHPGAVSFPRGENLAQVRKRAWEGLNRIDRKRTRTGRS